MRTARLAKLTLGIALVSILVGCTSLLNPRNVTPPPLKPDSEANFQALNAQLSDSCAAPILEPERSALLQEALADSQLQAVKAQLERRGLGMNADEAQAVQLVGGEQLLIPFGQDAHLVWTRTNGQTAAVGLIRQGNKTLNVGADGQERVVRFLSAQKAEKLLRKLRERSKFQEFEGKLAQKGKRVGKVRVLFDETNKIAILGIASEGSDEKIAHQVRIKVKAGKDDEPEDDAEPMIQATACGQASGEAVPTGARMQPLMLDPGEGGDVTTGSYTLIEGDYGPEICTSQWGYDYLCTSTTPMLRLSLSRLAPTLALPPTFINQQVQASFTIWNGGGGRLTGTVSAQAPFSIVSGGSFSLLPGQPQEVVVRFSSGTAGSFSKSIAISSNGGSATVTATAVAHKVSFSPAQVDFGSGLFVLREQCDSMGGCGLRTEKVGLPIEKALTVKNEGSVSVSLTLSTAGPYKIVSVPPTLSPGQSAQVILRFDPSRMVYVAPRVAVEEVESGEFRGSLQVGISEGQGSLTVPLVGTAHKIEIDPAVLDFGIVFVGSTAERKLTVKNQGVTTVTLEVPNTTQNTASPFRIMVESMSGSPLVLGSGKSTGVPVQFSATTSGQFTGTARLIINNSFNLEVPLTARAVTFEEFLQLFGTLFVPGTPNLFFDGFEGLNISLADFQSLAQELLTRQPQPPTPEDLEIAQALEELKTWLDDPAFEQKIQELMQQYPAFRTFVNHIQNEILNLGVTSQVNYVQVLQTLARSLDQPSLTPGDHPLPIPSWGIPSADIAIYTALLVAAAEADPEFRNLNFFLGGQSTGIRAPQLFVIAVGFITGSLGPNCGDSCLINVAERLRVVAATIGTSAFHNQFKGLLMEVFVAFDLRVFWGWDLLNFSQPFLSNDGKRHEIDIIAKRFVPGIGEVVAYIEVKSDKSLSAQDILEKLEHYDYYIKNIGEKRYQGDFHVVVLISFEQTSATTVENALDKFDSTTPAIIIYCVSNCNGFGEGTFNVKSKNMTPAQVEALLTWLGFVPIGQGLYTSTLDPVSIKLLLMAWFIY
jgi:hypothetical protein